MRAQRTQRLVVMALLVLVLLPVFSIQAQGSGLVAIGYGQTVQGEIKKAGPDGTNGYVFPGSRGDVITVKVMGSSKSFTPQAILAHIVNKKAVGLATAKNGVIASFALPDEDAYIILVFSDKSVGKYTLSLESAGGQAEEPTSAPADQPTTEPEIGGGGGSGSGRLAYASNADGNWDIYTASADGSDAQRLTLTAGNEFSPSWSPDGSKVAYRYEANNKAAIYVMNTDGSASHKVTKGNFNDYYATWSPDGTQFAVSSGTAWNAGDIYVMNVDGSNRKLVAKTNNTGYSPIWSADGQKLLFTRVEGGSTSVYTVNADGTQLTRLVANARDGNWSPDGKTLVFASDRTGNGDVYISKGSRITQVTKTNETESRPMWSPDGTQIALMQSADGGTTWNVMVMKADGSNMTQIAPNSVDECWSPQ